MRAFFTDQAARGYRELSPCGKKYIYAKATTTLDARHFSMTSAMDAAIAKGELLKANIASMREARKRKY